ncbi:MAG: porin [Kofleriaceae bacterium]|nr:porin [Kofleriaceae bacterium]
MLRLLFALVLASAPAFAQPADPAPPGEPTPSDAGPSPEPPQEPPPVSTPPVEVARPVPMPDPMAVAEPAPAPNAEVWRFEVGGFIQPQYRWRQDSDVQYDQDGFRFARVRPILTAASKIGSLEVSGFLELELQPTFEMVDAYMTFSHGLANKGGLALDVGQMRVPISRQQLLSDSRISFVDKAQFAVTHPAGVMVAPKRDLGARVTLMVPSLPQVVITGGIFNGEGPNQIENINEDYLYAGRIEVTPFGPSTLAESAFGEDYLSLGASVGHNALTAGLNSEQVTYLGADIAGSWKGLSGSVEYLRAKHDLTEMQAIDYLAEGWMAQVAYLFPFTLPPGASSSAGARIELAARIEEVDRNDAVAIAQPGDPEQSVRGYTGCLSYYLRAHSLKAQLAFTHYEEIEDLTVQQQDAVYDNDQLLLQLTYRLE